MLDKLHCCHFEGEHLSKRVSFRCTVCPHRLKDMALEASRAFSIKTEKKVKITPGQPILGLCSGDRAGLHGPLLHLVS